MLEIGHWMRVRLEQSRLEECKSVSLEECKIRRMCECVIL